MHKFIGIFFAIACIATSAVSNSIMGAGLWFWVITATGLFVAISQFLPWLRGIGSGFALILSVLSVCAIVLGLLAATIGGSFNMDGGAALLLLLFFLIAVLGFIVSSLYTRSTRSIEHDSP